ncbi:hypothetical protein J0B03_02885 [Alkalibacter rhizosphaerae]|uniref:DUF916 domain-containing protein n=1 Tax=Alkalibacter rhizosphaerae TaxID=2815577 RepID=A0A974XFR7_9FIRM|nr:hypothetical protein [Alkalibacter rhizosphaerae]QSX09029.1 hypothetical protein J0B03_02885 [Alkalibacter rhizosphaerae]
MKRRVLFLLLMVFWAARVLGNSTPVRWEDSPISVLMSVDPNTTIAVTEEVLTFDFTEEEQTDFSYKGRVEASYTMINTGSEKVNSSMAFPIIGSIAESLQDDVQLTADGKEVDHATVYGDRVDDLDEVFADLSVETILGQLDGNDYKPENFDMESAMTCYTFNVETPLEAMDLEVSWQDNGNQSHFSQGFNGYQIREDGGRTASSWIRNDGIGLKIYSLQNDLNFTYSGEVLEEGNERQATDAFTVSLEKEELPMDAFIVEFMTASSYGGLPKQTVLDHLDFYIKELDRSLDHSPAVITESDVEHILSTERYIIFVYDVPFQANEIQNSTITYSTSGIMDRSRTVTPTYTYQYLLKPAEHWKSFQNLTIRVLPPKEAPYMIDSSMSFERSEDGNYIAAAQELPTENLQFTLFEKEQIGTSDRIKGYINNHLYGLLIFGVPLAGLLVLGILARMLIKIWKK